ncbi:MAG: hypothetical protein IPL52_09690 [Flavobacteriales bacterium]|nr:hypothetical protein [Flavobacteriales bacterium]
MLTERTLDAQLTLADRTADTIYYDLRLENRAGHRFPSGYPSRRAFVEFVVLSAAGDTVFKSGRLDGDYEVEAHDAGYEPHYDVITAGDQVQIYELVMGDVNGDVTTVLERAKDPLKDNRLVPVGFTTAHPSYDTTLVAGVPASDIDFNRNTLGEEGSGSDIVHYHVPITGMSDGLRAYARIYYQPLPPGWNAELFSASHSDIQFFEGLLQASDKSPTLVTEDSLAVGPAGIAEATADRITLFPNPTTDGWILVACDARLTVMAIEDVRGARVPARIERTMQGVRVQLPEAMGLYVLRMRVEGAEVVKRVLRR